VLDGLAAAKEVMDDDTAEQSDIDLAAGVLDAVIQSLVKAVLVSITGADAVVSGPGATAEYAVSYKNAPKISGIELEFEIDGDYLEANEFTAVGFSFFGDGNFGTPVYWRIEDGKWIGKVTLINAAGTGGDSDFLKMAYNVKEGIVGVSGVTLRYVELSYEGFTIPSEISVASAATTFSKYYSRYDLNKDGTVNLNDITYALMYFMVGTGEPGWEKAEAADFNGDGCITVEDLVLILANYTIPYYM
jgi:hypothetical protein